mmetsp:Transcript_761/g.1352  ORF Transcript_761/g.1352 Transcript_761/m.1352 type:complete len:843 (+) Transcript_761:236-2764(+)|eukprot:CAMPEP_0198201390 /NCGR_PEP_ID=MMETSP1445-20131203/4223_1 /TAXON_ID=36898 /ORGANISM="Pyramimonas sp., Strain CCMP2087" /LENGTH=842 /DNA_ID=CAMNT_0043871725 /DNA_START=155 /DNA_END=2683 /DNA_ORIENTATION=-
MGCVTSKEGNEGKGSKEIFDDPSVHSKFSSQKTKAVKVRKPASHKTLSRWKPAVDAPVEVAGLEKVKEGKERAPVVPLRLTEKEYDEVVERRATEFYGSPKRARQQQLFTPAETISGTQPGWSPQQQPQIGQNQYQTNQYGEARPQAPVVSQYLSVSYNPTYEPNTGTLRLASPDDHRGPDDSAESYNNTTTAGRWPQNPPTSTPLLPHRPHGEVASCKVQRCHDVKQDVENLDSSRLTTVVDSSRSRSTECSCEPQRLSTSLRLFDQSFEQTLDRSTGYPSSSSITQLYRNVSPKAPGARSACEAPTLLGRSPTDEIQTIYQAESIKVRDRENVSQQFQARTVDCIKLLHLDARSEGSVESNYMNLCRRSSHGYDFMSVDSLEEYNNIAPPPSLRAASSLESTQDSEDSSNVDAASFDNIPQIRSRTQSGTTSTGPHIPEKVEDAEIYHFLEEIGRGSSAVVMRAEDAGEEVAVKMFDIRNESIKSDLKIKILSVVSTEMFILKTIQHSSIIKFRKSSAKGTHRYLELELCKGGDLQADLLRQGRYSEDMAREMFRQTLCALEVLHANNVVHNDIKLENLLLQTSGDARSVKLVDFGLAHITDLDGPYNFLVGTFEYMPPELVLQCQADRRTLAAPVKPTCAMDMWSAGVVLFMMLGGHSPFQGTSTKHVFESIVDGNVHLEAPVWRTVSEAAKDLISKLLMKNPVKRLTAWDALQHPWFGASYTPQSTRQPALFRGIQRRRFKRAVWAIVAVGLLTKKMLLNRMVSRILYRSPYPVSPAAYLPDNFDRAAATLFTGCSNFLPKNDVRSSHCAQKVFGEVPTNGNRISKLGGVGTVVIGHT